MTDELPWLTLTDAAELTGLNRETIRSRARRSLIPSRRGNAGQLLVQVTGAVTARDQGMTDQDTASDRGLTEVMTELQEELTDLRDRVTRAEAERDAAREVAEAKVMAMERQLADLREQLAWHRRSWWRRLRG
jgi:hypothetical protein